MSLQKVLIAGKWRDADATGTFQAENPAAESALPDEYPVSSWSDCRAALDAAAAAYLEMRTMDGEKIATFLEAIADRIESRADELVEMAHLETALPKSPRLADVELPRTTGQLRQAATAARSGSWRNPVIDSENGIASCYGPIGPVAVFGPNNFPFAFGSASGGDFAAAIAAGNPVIAKANSSHPGTTRIFAECAQAAAESIGMPAGTVQLLYRTGHADGEKLVSDPRIAATGYTGSRGAGLKLKAAADAAGKLIYLELSSVNPVVILPGALAERGDALAEEFTGSCLMGAGQFCTNPGLVVLLAGEATESFVADVAKRFSEAPVGTLLSKSVANSLIESLGVLENAGAEVLTGNSAGGGTGYSAANSLLRVSGEKFVADPETFQTEAFGNASLIVVAADLDEACAVIDSLEGNLTGCVYTDTNGSDDAAYDQIEPGLRAKVGRLLNDKMPTGVAVSPAMNHGGPYPATGHAGFTAVGIPAAIPRFAALHCYDNVREHRLPTILRG
ncbi:MAG: aldehyde dehydrogenase (NADP(+)) [Verrucomicrobiales bacterium]|nr:aldehyde dehydrogenase (NADP(+)) [Verrucomicrobiales bacterium]